ncbi:MAG: molybdopterin molybdotransferase MoeA [Dehalococcoidales bacterium]|nr:molybdopterin molybdotransferase MoeA [Dehalococcoidales bacterium]
MLSVEEALQKILAEVNVLEAETVPIMEALGQVLAEDIISDINVPPLDNSAMDGFAVQSKDTRGASEKSPITLKVTDTVLAGGTPKKEIVTGTAIRIMTGAPIPSGADSIVQFEDTDDQKNKDASSNQRAGQVSIFAETRPGRNVRRTGESIAKDKTTLKRGTVIRPAEIGLMASIGKSRVKVIRRPVVAILSTGDELIEVEKPLPDGKIHDSNAYSIAGLVKRYGCIPKMLGIARDSEKELVKKLKQAQDADMLLTTGGVSMGDYDLVKDIIARDGEMVFWKVRVKPGKPLAFGKIKGRDKNGRAKNIPHLGLPGNATSCMVSFELFVRPTLLKMMGKQNLAKPSIDVIIENTIINDAGRRIYDRAIIEKRNGHYYARLTGPQGSGILSSMSLANGLVVIPEETEKVNKGDTVQALMLDWNEEVNI